MAVRWQGRCFVRRYGALEPGRLRRRNEFRCIPSERNHDAQRAAGPLGFVIFAEFLPQAVDFDAYDCVFGRIEAFRPFENFDCDVVFLDVLGLPLEAFRAQVLEQARKPRRSIESCRTEDPLNLRPPGIPQGGP